MVFANADAERVRERERERERVERIVNVKYIFVSVLGEENTPCKSNFLKGNLLRLLKWERTFRRH
jgi:hypothetical protein